VNKNVIYRVLTEVYNTQNYWVSGLRPLSEIASGRLLAGLTLRNMGKDISGALYAEASEGGRL
jgi:hypothetical protein